MKPYYQDDCVTLYNGSCLDVLPTLDHADLVLTDPPYGVNLEYASYDDTEDNWYALMTQAIPAMRSAADMVIMPSCSINKLPWIYTHHAPDWLIAWHKGSPGHVSKVGFNDWEPLLVYGRTKKLSMHDHFTASNDQKMGKYGHPCPKPIKWATWLLSRACPEGGTVVDPFAGSGTTLRAAKDQNLKCIGIELDESYCEIIAGRLDQGTLF